ncbi:MAG TPA: NAD(P)/FAD-dependent oxidoreductase [Dehalococcoidia bacterium]|nr:NAD(P)/FAD-dependent oxidoreductase [Dehalococcoidia bacterium]
MYDAIVVGARVAGAPTAMLLARKGHRVLLLDRDTFPSDIMSTHFLTQPGVAQLNRWGLLDQVAATGCPPISRLRNAFGPIVLDGTPLPLDGAGVSYCPRRTVLDDILVRAAVTAGAELREGFAVDEVLFEGAAVSGIGGRDRASGAPAHETAGIVIGADGLHSRVAAAVQPAEYNVRPGTTCGYYSYWSGIPDEGAAIIFGAERYVFRFPTNDGLTCLAMQLPKDAFTTFREDIEGNFMRGMRETAPELAAQAAAGHREERFIGASNLPNFYRKPFGPGWALVGDAGYHKDPVTGQGITDAFRDAELLAEAIDAGFAGRQPLEQALAGYEQQRNAATAAIYETTCQLASFAPPQPEQLMLLAAVSSSQEDTNRFFGVLSGSVSGEEFFGPENIGRMIARAQGAGGPHLLVS